MNIGSTYDRDLGNEVILGDITVTRFDNSENLKATGTYQYDNSDNKTDKYKSWKPYNGTMTFSMREPVIVKPLGYYSTRGGSKTMNNTTSIDLEYNFNNLRNMIQFNCGKMYTMSSKYYIGKENKSCGRYS